MRRILLLIADADLAGAVAAVLGGDHSVRSANADDPGSMEVALHGGEWDVCIADATAAADAIAARRGRGLVLLGAHHSWLEALQDRTPGAPVVRLRIPCAVGTLRDAVALAADADRPTKRNV